MKQGKDIVLKKPRVAHIKKMRRIWASFANIESSFFPKERTK
jgi:hypothetical protein